MKDNIVKHEEENFKEKLKRDVPTFVFANYTKDYTETQRDVGKEYVLQHSLKDLKRKGELFIQDSQIKLRAIWKNIYEIDETMF